MLTFIFVLIIMKQLPRKPGGCRCNNSVEEVGCGVQGQGCGVQGVGGDPKLELKGVECAV
jgi:hypothetical protein